MTDRLGESELDVLPPRAKPISAMRPQHRVEIGPRTCQGVGVDQRRS